MGMFNTVYANCVKCGEFIEFQSKSGSCSLAQYTLDTAPISDLADIIGEEFRCLCGTLSRIMETREGVHFVAIPKGARGECIGDDCVDF